MGIIQNYPHNSQKIKIHHRLGINSVQFYNPHDIPHPTINNHLIYYYKELF